MLYCHTGATATTLNDIRANYRVPTREEIAAKIKREGAGNRWAPIHHADLIDAIRQEADDRGFEIANERYALSKDTHSVFGFLQFREVEGFNLDGAAPVLGFRSDNLQRFRVLGVSGARVFVCDNGAIVGDFVFGMKHTSGNVDQAEVGIHEGFGTYQRQTARMGEVVDRLRDFELSQRDADHALMEGVRDGAMALTFAGRVDRTYGAFAHERNPFGEAFRPRNAWSLYNAATEVAKGTSPVQTERVLKSFPRTLARLGGFDDLLDAPAEVVPIESAN